MYIIGPSYFLFIRQSNGPSYPSNGPIQWAIHTTVQWLYWAILPIQWANSIGHSYDSPMAVLGHPTHPMGQSNGPSYPSNGPIQWAIHTTVQWLYWAILLLFHTTMDDQQSLLATLSYVCNPINCSYGIVAKYKVDC